MNYLQQLSWYKEMEKFDEVTRGILYELSNPTFNARSFRAIVRLNNGLNEYSTASILKQLSVDGYVRMRVGSDGKEYWYLSEHVDISPASLVIYRVNDKTKSSLVHPSTRDDMSFIVNDFISKCVGGKKKITAEEILDMDGIYTWSDNVGNKYSIEMISSNIIFGH
jgi:hypothetical protein